MNINRRSHPDHVQVELGNAQRWVMGALLTVMLSVFGIAAKSSIDWATKMDDRASTQTTQLALANSQLAMISTQLADLPALRQALATNTGQIARNTDDIKDLKSRLGK